MNTWTDNKTSRSIVSSISAMVVTTQTRLCACMIERLDTQQRRCLVSRGFMHAGPLCLHALMKDLTIKAIV